MFQAMKYNLYNMMQSQEYAHSSFIDKNGLPTTCLIPWNEKQCNW